MKSLKDIFSKTIILEAMRITQDSVDSQIDSILMGYQGKSVQEGKLPKNFALLLEAPEDEEDVEGEEDQPDETVGDDQVVANDPSDPPSPTINIDEFAGKVVNLLENYENLLTIDEVIINRAKKILTENGYNEATLAEFDEVLDREFGISLDGEDELPLPPPGGNAGPIS